MPLPFDIFGIDSAGAFGEAALGVFRFQAEACAPYRAYLELIGVDPEAVDSVEKIPFLPIGLFKTHDVYSAPAPPQKTFTSSATSGMTPSRHMVADISLYEESFTRCFRLFYGDPRNMAILALLPNYLEREGSSLVHMADRLTGMGRGGGFYLDDLDRLVSDMEKHEGPKLLLGVSYALLDLAGWHPCRLRDTIVMETGGMKGRREELPKEELHARLCDAFGVGTIHSEYGMAELLSQAYSHGCGIFSTPPWMKVTVRDINDPFALLPHGAAGGINVIDLANYWSCSFVQTQDLGTSCDDGSFRIHGRITGSEIRGCNLLVQ